MSSTTRFHLPFASERFDVRRNRFALRLASGVHAGRGEVFDLAVHQQPQRAAAIGFAEIECERVRLGESLANASA